MFHHHTAVYVRGAVRELHVSKQARDYYTFDASLFSVHGNLVIGDLSLAQRLAEQMNRKRPQAPVRAGDLYAVGLMDEVMHLVLAAYSQSNPEFWQEAESQLESQLGSEAWHKTLHMFAERFPATAVYQGEMSLEDYLAGSTDGVPNRHAVIEELLLLYIHNENPALEPFLDLFDDSELERQSAYKALILAFEAYCDGAPSIGGQGLSLFHFLRAPVLASPTSLQGQLEYMRGRWGVVLGNDFDNFFIRILRGLDTLKEEQKGGGWGFSPGPAPVLTRESLRGEGAQRGYTPVEYEAYSSDSSWMPQLVMMAKSTYVWLDQLSKRFSRPIHRLDHIPDEVLDELASWGFSGLWLIGLWERSRASQKIKHLMGNPDAVASAYALHDYAIADDLGGEEAYEDLRQRAWQRGIRLASDMVPNHVGIDGRWVVEHPQWFLSLEQAPYAGYSFNGPDLSEDPRVSIHIEDHYYDQSDAAVVFKRTDKQSGESRYIYHGNDGTTMPWNDTAQLNYLSAEVREGVIQTILHVARKFPIIRFDAAMTLAKQHIQRLWFPQPGAGGAIPSRSQYGLTTEEFDRLIPTEFWREVVDRVAQEAPDTLLLAEAFWMMEGYFVRTLGMHRVYNSAFMNMLKREDNAGYRQTIKNVLEFDPEILKRFVNFMNNPDEETAIAQFGKDDKYFGVCMVMATIPGLPMFGHGQIEGYTEKYGMEYRRPKYDESPDGWLVDRHRREIFPLLQRRYQFVEVDNFLLYDLYQDGQVNENVLAYSNYVNGQASLVVYNNKFADAIGWLKASLPYSAKVGSGREQKRRQLAEGLGIHGGEGRFVILREHIAGLEYLRPSQALIDQGLFVSLGAFKYQVFMDIREVHDSQGYYQRLHEALQGRPVPSIQEAIDDMHLQPLHDAFQRIFNLSTVLGVSKQSKAGFGSADIADLQRSYRDFLQAQQDFGVTWSARQVQQRSEDFGAYVQALWHMPELQPSLTDVAQREVLEQQLRSHINGNTLMLPMLYAWSCLQPLAKLPANLSANSSQATAEASAASEISTTTTASASADKPEALPVMHLGDDAWTLVQRWRLQRVVEQSFSKMLSEAAPLERMAWLLELLLRPWPQSAEMIAQLESSDDPEMLAEDILAAWFADDQAQRFLQLNEHQGYTWFNREAYQDLSTAVLLTLSLECLRSTSSASHDSAALEQRLGNLCALGQAFKDAEQRSGYRVDKLLPHTEAWRVVETETAEAAETMAETAKTSETTETTATVDSSQKQAQQDI